MGVSISHDSFDGSCTFFNDMRSAITKAAGYGDYREMVSLDEFPKGEDALNVLLEHSDCDGIIKWEDCIPLADRLSEIHSLIESPLYANVLNRFIHGLRHAALLKEDVEFN